ncbi:MAG: hypothetical protein JW986_01140 [Methanotrichaceae archaeon]|nr:hypothetical protein [Methanotrichaceae archaeon]
MSKPPWPELVQEVEELCRWHGDGLADFTKCREFGGRLSHLLERLEDEELYALADRVMDIMASCSPKQGSHCDISQATGARLKLLSERIREEARDARKSRPPEGAFTNEGGQR